MTDLSPAVRTLIEGPNQAHLATILPGGAPHSVPLWIGMEGDRIAFLTGPGSRKAHNLEADRGWPSRSPTASSPSPWRPSRPRDRAARG